MKTQLEIWYGLKRGKRNPFSRPESIIRFAGNHSRGVNRINNLQHVINREVAEKPRKVQSQ